MAVKYDRRCGQCLNTKIDIWSNGQGQPDDFISLITFVTSRYVGGLVLNEEDGGVGGQIVVSIQCSEKHIWLDFVHVSTFFFGGVAGSKDFACATLPTIPLDFQGKV